MANFRDNGAIHPESAVDGASALRHSFNAEENALDVNIVNGLVPFKYTRVIYTFIELGGIKDIDTVTFYNDDYNNKTTITVTADVGGSLNNTYFMIYSARNATAYYVWYNVGGLGTDPNIADATGIEITIQPNDYKQVVGLATKQAINANDDFTVTSANETLFIENVNKGFCDETVDNNTGFTFSTTQGGSQQRAVIQVGYNDDHVINSIERIL
jgi:hypothetical protein